MNQKESDRIKITQNSQNSQYGQTTKNVMCISANYMIFVGEQ